MASLVLALSVPASAKLNTVDTGTDGTGAASQRELRDAIVAANTDTAVDGCVAGNGADEIHFSQAGTVTLSAELPTIEQDLELVGLGPSKTTVNGVRLYRQTTAGSFLTVRVADLTLRDGMNAVEAGCLLTLGNNGGPLPTLLPLAGSLAIDQGACAGEVSDQRGFGNFATGLRVVDDLSVANQADGRDIGAVDVGASDALFADGFETGDTLQWSSTTP